MARRDPSKGLGRTQRLVLHLLAFGAKSTRTLAYDMPLWFTPTAMYGAVMRLANRGLVDFAGWDESQDRTYCLTERGAAVERALDPDPELEDDDG